MKYEGQMLVVKDINKSRDFYLNVIGVEITEDLGENISFGDVSIQSESSWSEFTKTDSNFFDYRGNTIEVYFEEENFDEFLKRVEDNKVKTIGEAIEMPWGQRVIRFYDPDQHVIQVGEDLVMMMKGMSNSGMSLNEISEKTFMDQETIEKMINS